MEPGGAGPNAAGLRQGGADWFDRVILNREQDQVRLAHGLFGWAYRGRADQIRGCLSGTGGVPGAEPVHVETGTLKQNGQRGSYLPGTDHGDPGGCGLFSVHALSIAAFVWVQKGNAAKIGRGLVDSLVWA